MSETINIILIEDNPGDSRLIVEYLKDCKNSEYEIIDFISLNSFFAKADGLSMDVILLDLSLPDSKGLDTLDKVINRFPQIPIVILTGLDDEEIAIKAMRQGAQDYLVKNEINTILLNRIIRYAIERKKTGEKRKERKKLRSPI